MRSPSRRFILIGIGALLLSSCAQRETPSVQRPPPAPSPQQAAPLSAAQYVATASSIDLLVIEAADLAAERASSARLRDLAAKLRRDHAGISAQLSFAGRRLNVLPSATLQSRHQAMLGEITAATDFAAAWKRVMIAVHEQGVGIHGDFARAGTSPTLRPVADFALPAMRRHLTDLRGL